MAKKNLIGAWAFLIAVILAIVIGILGLDITSGTWAIVLVVLGVLVGLLNVSSAELKDFMLAGTVLVIVSALGGQTYLSLIPYVSDIIAALVMLFVPATIIVALRAVFALAKK